MSALAVEGGSPVRESPFPPWPVFAEDEISKVGEVLRSGRVNYWTGTQVRSFEQEFADYVGMPYAIGLANGTVALELALRALGIGPGDEVVVPSRTFVATASSVAVCGARPVFADIDERSQNLTADSVRAVLTSRTRAVIPVHLAGWPCDMESLSELALSSGLKLIEDCAQAHGATYRGRRVGSFGDAAAFSFCQDKIMTTGGEGGMLLLRDPQLWRRAWAFKDHGKSVEAVFERDYSENPFAFRWLHDSIGTNWRMTEMQAALGRAQLAKLDSWLSRRRHHAARLTAAIRDLPGLHPTSPPDHVGHAFYKYYATLDEDRFRGEWSQNRIIEAINAEGVPCLAGACPEVYRENAFSEIPGMPQRPLPGAHRLRHRTLMFQVHPTLGDDDIDDVTRALTKVIGESMV